MRRLTLSLFSLAMLGAFAAPASAATIGGEVYGSFNTYAMGDWNDLLQEANEMGANFDEIKSGFGGGIGGRLWPSESILLSVAWEPLFAGTDDQGIEAKVDANGFLGTVAYMGPAGATAKYGLGAGIGFYSVAGKVTAPGESDVKLTGSGVGFHVLGLAEWTVSPGFGITAGAGYRAAKIADTKADGESSDPTFETDYSGITGRVGLVFYLPNAN